MPITQVLSIFVDNLEECIFEAKRFTTRAEECLKNLLDCSNDQWPDKRLSAAVRRSSMDLTRALAKLRKY